MDLRNWVYLRSYRSRFDRVLQRRDVSLSLRMLYIFTTDSVQSMYDRTLKPIPPRLSTGFRYRFETLIGTTGMRMAKYRSSLSTIIFCYCWHCVAPSSPRYPDLRGVFTSLCARLRRIADVRIVKGCTFRVFHWD